MGTRFKGGGNKTGFNPSGSNDVTPNFMGPPKTKFTGRGAVPSGELKGYPGAVADIEGGNRRLAKANHGEGSGAGTRFSGRRTAFNRKGT